MSSTACSGIGPLRFFRNAHVLVLLRSQHRYDGGRLPPLVRQAWPDTPCRIGPGDPAGLWCPRICRTRPACPRARRPLIEASRARARATRAHSRESKIAARPSNHRHHTQKRRPLSYRNYPVVASLLSRIFDLTMNPDLCYNETMEVSPTNRRNCAGCALVVFFAILISACVLIVRSRLTADVVGTKDEPPEVVRIAADAISDHNSTTNSPHTKP